MKQELIEIRGALKSMQTALKQNQRRQSKLNEKLRAEEAECLALENRIGDLKMEIAELEGTSGQPDFRG